VLLNQCQGHTIPKIGCVSGVKVPRLVLKDVVHEGAAEYPTVIAIVLLGCVYVWATPSVCGEGLSDSLEMFVLEVAERCLGIGGGPGGGVVGIEVCDGVSGEVDANTGPVGVMDVDRDQEAFEEKDVAAWGPVGPAPDSIVVIDVAFVWVIVVGLKQGGEEERGVDVASGVGDLEQSLSLGLSLAVEDDVTMEDSVVHPLSWGKGSEGASGKGDSPNLAEFLFRGARSM
jgi:hypothetical protein